MDEYIIVNKTAIQKRIDELEKTNQIQRVDELENVLFQSTPLIPEIEKAFDAGYDLNTWEQLKVPNEERDYLNEQDYISNLKLDI